MTRIIALLAFYDEPLASLASMMEGLDRIGAEHLVAVDGAYRLYPGGQPASPLDQHGLLTAQCRRFGIGLTLVTPATVWEGNETEKRTALFRYGLGVSAPGDWFYVTDADETIRDAPADLLYQLASTPHDVASVRVVDDVARRIPGEPEEFQTRRLFRAQPIHVEVNHFTYVASETGAVLWEGSGGPREAPALDLTDDVTVVHQPMMRAAARQAAKQAYYTRRDERGEERGICSRCEERAVERMPTTWRFPAKGGRPVARLAEFCDAHAREQRAINRRVLLQRGLDPEMSWSERYRPVGDADPRVILPA